MTACDLFAYYLIAAFIATLAAMLIGARLYRRRNEKQCGLDAATHLHGAGGGEITFQHSEGNTDA